MTRITLLLFLLLLFNAFTSPDKISAQDTLSVNLADFIERGLERSGQVNYESGAVDIARNRSSQARAQRILPRMELNTQHGLIPGVRSNIDGLPDGQLYLDPNLENDWEDWAIFTRAELNAVQPVFSWGAINNAIEAAESGARAAEFQFEAVKSEAAVQLYELYFSYLLAIEVNRILQDADDQIRQVERQIERMKEEGDASLSEADIFKFEIYQHEFEVNKVEVEQSMASVQRIWNYILQDGSGSVYTPEERFLDPVAFELESYDYYQDLAMNQRPELQGVRHGMRATERGVDAVRAQQYPMMFVGITGSFANTPNRPRQTNPFIINNSNYATGAVGIGIRQNLNFRSMRNDIDRAEIEKRRVTDLRDALSDGIVLELNDTYQKAAVAEVKVNQTRRALSTARNWVRSEQLDYDLGFGDVEQLLEAVQKELELRVELKQNIFDLNKRVAELYKAAGIPVSQLSTN
ncbi:MAG: TolC family protein [Balneolaceae bacterium]|nr:TolC family protein [Balneolaceae bacterium]MCH8547445.1 TolC family protein [Balneolaceae bacterium]